jgi:hypothetical protein
MVRPPASGLDDGAAFHVELASWIPSSVHATNQVLCIWFQSFEDKRTKPLPPKRAHC